jgi:uncharacterized membrane protein
MNSYTNIKSLLDYLQGIANKPLAFDEEAIVLAYQKNSDKQSLAIKILSVVGGILASFAFLGFLLLAGLYDSAVGLLIFGLLSIIGAIIINKVFDKIIIDTFSVSSYIIGLFMIGFSCSQFKMEGESMSLVFFFIALGTLGVVRNYMLSFISILIACGSILSLLISANQYDLIHGYVAIMALFISYFILGEAKIIIANKVMAKLYDPMRIGFIFSFLFGLVLLGKRGILPINNNFIWLSAPFILGAIIYTLTSLVKVLDIHQTKHKIYIYLASLLLLLPVVAAPAIAGAILIMLLCFFVNYKTGFILGIVSLIYFIAQYYYDLHFTLLAKSILLFASGILLIVLYLFTYRKLTGHENEKI